MMEQLKLVSVEQNYSEIVDDELLEPLPDFSVASPKPLTKKGFRCPRKYHSSSHETSGL